MRKLTTVIHNTGLKYILLMLVFLYGTQALAGISIIVNKGSEVTSLSSKQAKNIFLGKKSKFPNGSKAVPVDQSEGSAARSTFTSKVLGKSQSQISAYWSKMIFSGKASPPKTVKDDAAVKAHVGSNPDAVGYIDSALADDSIKVVLSID